MTDVHLLVGFYALGAFAVFALCALVAAKERDALDNPFLPFAAAFMAIFWPFTVIALTIGKVWDLLVKWQRRRTER